MSRVRIPSPAPHFAFSTEWLRLESRLPRYLLVRARLARLEIRCLSGSLEPRGYLSKTVEDEPPRVVRVDRPQHIVGQAEPVDLPSPLAAGSTLRVVGERLVASLEEPRVHGPRGRVRRGVGPEQHAVVPAEEEAARAVRLPSELRDPGGDVDVPVRVRREHAIDAPEILRRASDVRADERRPGMPCDDGLESVDELVERRKAVLVRPAPSPCRPEVPVRMRTQLLVSLVRRVEGLEERDWVGDVDRHRQPERSGCRPEGVEPRVVHWHEPAGRVACPEPEQLPHLSLIHISEPTRLGMISYAVFCLK